ncbi:hypothetical protein [Photobacterium makurazakiensis]|uniref:hypothetical protein n=1 Tax=Photobacterium makurazakiensis TaxID=2910234 RepID=UPI003D0A6FF9
MIFNQQLNKQPLLTPGFAIDIVFIGLLKVSLYLDELEKYDKKAKALRREDRQQ